MQDILNCPFCQAEAWGCSEGWGMSPEGWDWMERIHREKHINSEPHIESFKPLEIDCSA